MITIDQYLMGRNKIYPCSKEQLINAMELLDRVNALFSELGINPTMSSGYRPGHFNKAAGGSARSGHLTCQAIDIADLDGDIIRLITIDLLNKYDLYLEDGDYTKSWVHLDTRKRKNRVFRPY